MIFSKCSAEVLGFCSFVLFLFVCFLLFVYLLMFVCIVWEKLKLILGRKQSKTKKKIVCNAAACPVEGIQHNQKS